MEFLVTMTTRVPPGTADETVAQVRLREAAHSHDLAERGNLSRLWRPPLRPGEWRTLGLFAADGPAELETVLASMPLRIWRNDEVTPLLPHANDPALSRVGPGREFLITMTIDVPDGTGPNAVDDKLKDEAQRARELSRPRPPPATMGAGSATASPANSRPVERPRRRGDRHHSDVAAPLPVDDDYHDAAFASSRRPCRPTQLIKRTIR